MGAGVPQIPKRRSEDKPSRRLRKGMYILPSLFTTANIALGYYAILQVTHASAAEPWHFDNAAKAIGFAIFFDGMDGFIARMTRTSSDFGRELDSLADVITFGVEPALLGWMWGFRQLREFYSAEVVGKMVQLGATASFLFLMAGASRLARFNITVNPQPSNPGRPGKKYFVGMPIPAGAGVIAAVVHFADGIPIYAVWVSVAWLCLLLVAGYLMVSTWRFYSFKDIVNLHSRQPFRLIILLAAFIAGVWLFSGPLLFALSLLYMASGVFWRLQWLFRRKGSPPPPPYQEASQIS